MCLEDIEIGRGSNTQTLFLEQGDHRLEADEARTRIIVSRGGNGVISIQRDIGGTNRTLATTRNQDPAQPEIFRIEDYGDIIKDNNWIISVGAGENIVVLLVVYPGGKLNPAACVQHPLEP